MKQFITPFLGHISILQNSDTLRYYLICGAGKYSNLLVSNVTNII